MMKLDRRCFYPRRWTDRLRSTRGALLGAFLCPLLITSSSCIKGVDVGPASDPERFEETLRIPLQIEGPVLLQGRATMMDAEHIMDHETLIEGFTVILEEKLLHVQWDTEALAYRIVKEIDYATIREVRHRVFGATQYMIIETLDGEINGWWFHGAGYVNRPRTNQAREIVQERVEQTRSANEVAS